MRGQTGHGNSCRALDCEAMYGQICDLIYFKSYIRVGR